MAFALVAHPAVEVDQRRDLGVASRSDRDDVAAVGVADEHDRPGQGLQEFGQVHRIGGKVAKRVGEPDDREPAVMQGADLGVETGGVGPRTVDEDDRRVSLATVVSASSRDGPHRTRRRVSSCRRALARSAWTSEQSAVASTGTGCSGEKGGCGPGPPSGVHGLSLDPRSGWPYDLGPLWIMLFDLWLALRRGDPAGLPSSSTDRVARAGVAGVGSGGWGVAEGLVP